MRSLNLFHFTALFFLIITTRGMAAWPVDSRGSEDHSRTVGVRQVLFLEFRQFQAAAHTLSVARVLVWGAQEDLNQRSVLLYEQLDHLRTSSGEVDATLASPSLSRKIKKFNTQWGKLDTLSELLKYKEAQLSAWFTSWILSRLPFLH